MENAQPSPTNAPRDIHVVVVSPEEAAVGVAEFWSSERLIGVTCLDEGELTLRIGPSTDDVVLSARALTKALAEADHLLALY